LTVAALNLLAAGLLLSIRRLPPPAPDGAPAR
jgi:hypothetical protein